MTDCIFCKIVNGEIPAKKIYEDEDSIAFYDLNPKARIHVLVIPKKHIPTFMDVKNEDLFLVGRVHNAIQEVARLLNLDETGFRVINNCKDDGGQEVYHLHYHLLGGQKLPF